MKEVDDRNGEDVVVLHVDRLSQSANSGSRVNPTSDRKGERNIL